MMARKEKDKSSDPTGIAAIDRLAGLNPCSIQDYVQGVSAYVREQSGLTDGPKKASQIRLSNALARAFADELGARIPNLRQRLKTIEQKVAGGLRTANADVSESHELDGLRLAVELKPINLAVGRAIWNRFGDIRTFAVNIHLKFPFCVVGGVLVIPTYEVKNTNDAREAEETEKAIEDGGGDIENDADTIADGDGQKALSGEVRKPTGHLIDRAIRRLIRAGGRKSEAEAAHLLEGIAVVVYDPDKATIDPLIPAAGYGLRWEEFLDVIETAYRARFED